MEGGSPVSKKERHQLILSIIEQEDIDTQETLQRRLQQQDIQVTQATLSRDIQQLHLVKQRDTTGQYRYMAPSQSVVSFGLLQGAIIRTDYAGNMVAIHCHAGMAQAACASFDRMQHPDIVGTLAGDDTIFILMRTPEQAAAFAKTYHPIQQEENKTC